MYCGVKVSLFTRSFSQYILLKKNVQRLLFIANKLTLFHVTQFSLQILHQLPEGGGEPVSPSFEGFLRAAAGHNGGERSNRPEDEGRRRR